MNLKRREARQQFNEQLPGASFDHYYANAINGLTKQNPGLKGEELRQAAYKMMLSTYPTPTEEPTPSELPTINARASVDFITNKGWNGILKRIDAPLTYQDSGLAAPTVITPEVETPNYVFGNYTQDDLDAMSFNDAFAAARKAGQSTFYWRVGQNAKNKSGYYGTGLAKKNDDKLARFDASMNEVDLTHPIDFRPQSESYPELMFDRKHYRYNPYEE